MSQAVFHVEITEDSTKAFLCNLSKGVSKEDVEDALSSKGINTGIDWRGIHDALGRLERSDGVIERFPAALAPCATPSIQVAESEISLSKEETEEFLLSLRQTAQIGESADIEAKMNGGLYAKKGDRFMRIGSPADSRDIFGNKHEPVPAGLLLTAGEGVRSRNDGDGVYYSAAKDGYLGLSDGETLCMFSPIYVTPDNMQSFLFLLPVSYGRKLAISAHADALAHSGSEAFDGGGREKVEREAADAIDSGRIVKELLKQGAPAQPGRNAEIILNIVTRNDGPEEQIESIDFKAGSSFVEVEKGQVIAEKILMRPAKPGMDIYGNEIPVAEVHDESFAVADNIDEQPEDERIRYVAATDGIINLSQKPWSITEELHIKGKVDIRTGSIEYSKDVVIDGDVTEGFSVESGGNVVIKGTIENGVRVRCKGDLSVAHGILGSKTSIAANGNMAADFLQECTVRVEGDLTVRRYILNADVICRGSLRVDGKSVKNDTKGSVIGGIVCSLGSMLLHSTGSPMSSTSLLCGVDHEAEEMLFKLKGSLPILTRQVMKYQESIGVDLSQPRVEEILKKLPAYRKREIRETLLKLKEVAIQREKAAGKIPQLEKMVRADNLNDLSVTIQKHLIPDISLRIGDAERVMKTKASGVVFTLKDGQIVSSGP